MAITSIIAILTTIISVAVKVVGMPDQIKANHRRKSTDGLSGWFLMCMFVSYCMWVIHGILVHDMSLVIGQGLGVVTTAIIVGQMLAYRKSPKPATSKAEQQVTVPGSSAIQSMVLGIKLKHNNLTSNGRTVK